MRTLIERQIGCSCLKAACDMFNPSVDEVKDRFRAMFPHYAAVQAEWEDFRQRYLQATNALARETPYYQSLSPSERADFEARLARRCGNCGIRLLKAVMEEEEATSLSIFDLLRQSNRPVTRCVEGLPLPA